MAHENRPREDREAYSDEAVELLLHDPEKYVEQREQELAGIGSSRTSDAPTYCD
jgi:hypothetical protein